MGVEFFPPAKYFLGSEQTWRIVKPKGVIAKYQKGKEITAYAKSVIIATGGFGDNPEMINKYTGHEWGSDSFSIRIPGIVG